MTDFSPNPLASIKAHTLRGSVRVPGDKSISHRSLILGALATGLTNVRGLLEADDVLNTAKALTLLGAPVSKHGDTWQVQGRGTGGLVEPETEIDFGNSGTGARLLLGVIAGHDMTVRLTGDVSLSRRPMARVLAPLQQMGLEVADRRETLPLTVRGAASPLPVEYELPVASAQVKSAILLAGLMAPGTTTVVEREPTRDHTERMLDAFGAEITVEPIVRGTKTSVQGPAELLGRDLTVPGDPSSAAFFVAAALIVPQSEVTIKGVLVNSARIGFYTTLREMGADVRFLNERDEGGEPVADIRARSASELRGVRVPARRVPSMIDEYPILAVVAAFAKGETRMEGLSELRVKESDRLTATAEGLIANGVEAVIEGDSLIVNGIGRVAGGGLVATHLDHRIAMAFLTMGLASDRPVRVDDARMIATSFPDFCSVMQSLGAKFDTLERAPMVIAIDGPAASGKGTLAKKIAELFGFHCLDTGLLYRAVARDLLQCGLVLTDAGAAAEAARSLDPGTLDDPGLRVARMGDAASVVAKIPEVRAALLGYQRWFAAQDPGAVLDGRDIATVVCPSADVKIFVTATPEARAKRRFLELRARGEAATYDEVLNVIKTRDARDSERADAPMRRHEDAILLDTSELDIEAAFEVAVDLIKRKIGQPERC